MRVVFLVLSLLILAVGLAACTLGDIAPTTLPDAQPPAPPYVDVGELLAGICFEAALELHNQTFTLQNADDLTALYDRIDALDACRRPIPRADYPADEGVIVGRWDYGQGCTASHDITPQADNRLTVTFRTMGDCPYELIRPFWVLLPTTHTIQFEP